MKAVPAWVSYSIYRVLMFAVPLAILLSLGLAGWVAGLIAAVIGLCLSYLFLRKPRERVARDLYEARHPAKDTVHPDAESEDAAIDRAELAELADRLEREGEAEQNPVNEGREGSELEGKNKLS